MEEEIHLILKKEMPTLDLDFRRVGVFFVLGFLCQQILTDNLVAEASKILSNQLQRRSNWVEVSLVLFHILALYGSYALSKHSHLSPVAV